jgi:anti-sigma factor RsiW
MEHPTAERLEAYVEGSLDDGARAAVASHLLRCPHCEHDVEEWRSLFAVLRGLPRFAPAPGFASRVMAHVRVPRPWHARAGWFTRFLPRTTGGWAMATLLLALPVVTGVGFMTWLLSKSYVTAHGLWVFSTQQFFDFARRTAQGLFDGLLQTYAAAWVARGLEAAQMTGVRELGVVAAASGVLMMVSIWVLYRYLIRPSYRESTHVSFSV